AVRALHLRGRRVRGGDEWRGAIDGGDRTRHLADVRDPGDGVPRRDRRADGGDAVGPRRRPRVAVRDRVPHRSHSGRRAPDEFRGPHRGALRGERRALLLVADALRARAQRLGARRARPAEPRRVADARGGHLLVRDRDRARARTLGAAAGVRVDSERRVVRPPAVVARDAGRARAVPRPPVARRRRVGRRIRPHRRGDPQDVVGFAPRARERRRVPARPERRVSASAEHAPCTYNDAMTDGLARYRSEFPILARTTYLISNSLGAMPRGVADALQGYADTWATRGVRAWEERWWMLASEVGDRIAGLLHAPPGSVATHPNVTTCQAVVASCFDFSGTRNKIVYTDMNFPSVMYF